MHERVETWNEANPEGRWRCFGYNDLLKRDKLSLDLFWIKDKTLTDTDSLAPPDIIAVEIADDREAALNSSRRSQPGWKEPQPRMDEEDRDTLMRVAAFEHVRRLSEAHDGPHKRPARRIQRRSVAFARRPRQQPRSLF